MKMMNTVRQKHGESDARLAMSVARLLHGGQVKDLITKFYYSNCHLCFQILLQVDGEETIPYQDFSNYGEYKLAITALEQAKGNGTVIKIPEKKFLPGTFVSKVA